MIATNCWELWITLFLCPRYHRVHNLSLGISKSIIENKMTIKTIINYKSRDIVFIPMMWVFTNSNPSNKEEV